MLLLLLVVGSFLIFLISGLGDLDLDRLEPEDECLRFRPPLLDLFFRLSSRFRSSSASFLMFFKGMIEVDEDVLSPPNRFCNGAVFAPVANFDPVDDEVNPDPLDPD